MKEDNGDLLEDATFFQIVGALFLLLFSLRVAILGPPLRPAALRRYALGLAVRSALRRLCRLGLA